MNVSIADLVLGRVKSGIDAAAPKLGGAAFFGLVESVLVQRLGAEFPGQGPNYVRKLIEALEAPLPRVLVTAWRRYDELLQFTASDGRPASSGNVDLVQHETEAYWEVAPRFDGQELSGPRLVVSLNLMIEAGTIVVRDGRLVALEAGELKYRGEVRVKEAPEELATIGPGTLKPLGGRLDFGDGFPIRP